MGLHPNMTDEVFRVFERGSVVYPQPVAMSCGRIIRTRSHESLLDAVLKGGEIFARYLASVSIASFSARTDLASTLKIFSDLSGPLSFGSFLTIVQQAAKNESIHPIKPYLLAGFTQKKNPAQSQPNLSTNTEEALSCLLTLRNHLGHDLASVTKARAISILKEKDPCNTLAIALKYAENLLQLPIFVIEQQNFSRSKLIGQRLLLMGEAPDPSPDSIEITKALHWDGEPYIAIGNDAIPLYPMLAWRISPLTANYRLFVFDTIQERSVKYKAVEVSVYESNEKESEDLQTILSGTLRPAESASLADGSSMCAEWNERRKSLEQAREQLGGKIPWELFSAETVAWYAAKLPSTPDDAKTTIQKHLLDDVDHLNKKQIDEMILLFGEQKSVKKTLGRDSIDLRLVKTPNKRWDERIISHANVIDCLKSSVDFMSRHIGVGGVGVSFEGLAATSGSADYIAMREALVNLFIHQDYCEQSCPAQVEILTDKASFFNPGKSLVKQKSLIEGGKSQSRNPIIARALRLIGFAELAGSGLRQLQNAWRTQHRRPPQIESNQSSNSFTLTLDWRIIPDNYNSFWKNRLGVNLAPPEATILNLSGDGVTVDEAASATGLSMESSQIALDKLVMQALIDDKKGRYTIKDHLRSLIPPLEGS